MKKIKFLINSTEILGNLQLLVIVSSYFVRDFRKILRMQCLRK